MADVTINASPGSPAANAYCDVAFADVYHDAHPQAAAWTAATLNQKSQGLVRATTLIDLMFEFEGAVETTEQALALPRSGLCDRHGNAVPAGIVPIDAKRATAEFARLLLVSDRAADSDLEAQSVKSLTAGPVTLTFGAVVPKVVPDLVARFLEPFGRLRQAGPDRSIDLVRV